LLIKNENNTQSPNSKKTLNISIYMGFRLVLAFLIKLQGLYGLDQMGIRLWHRTFLKVSHPKTGCSWENI